MKRPDIEWDPSWDIDWTDVRTELEDELEDEHPLNPEQAVELYRYGYSAARKAPSDTWSDVEADLYEDYMTGAPEPGPPHREGINWDDMRDWARRGWEAGRKWGT